MRDVELRRLVVITIMSFAGYCLIGIGMLVAMMVMSQSYPDARTGFLYASLAGWFTGPVISAVTIMAFFRKRKVRLR